MNYYARPTGALTEDANSSVSPKQALSQKWVIGRGWVDAETLRLEEEQDAINEAMKGDDQFQRWADEQP